MPDSPHRNIARARKNTLRATCPVGPRRTNQVRAWSPAAVRDNGISSPPWSAHRRRRQGSRAASGGYRPNVPVLACGRIHPGHFPVSLGMAWTDCGRTAREPESVAQARQKLAQGAAGSVRSLPIPRPHGGGPPVLYCPRFAPKMRKLQEATCPVEATGWDVDAAQRANRYRCGVVPRFVLMSVPRPPSGKAERAIDP